jgi:hypothetical protein
VRGEVTFYLVHAMESSPCFRTFYIDQLTRGNKFCYTTLYLISWNLDRGVTGTTLLHPLDQVDV